MNAPPGPSSRASLPRLYAIIDTGVCARHGVAPDAFAAACLRGGARLLQLRVKDGSGRAFLELADHLVALARPSGALVVINDRADIARMAGAAGVHLGQDDLPVKDVRAWLGPDAIIGISTHDRAQVDAAVAEGPTYVAVGPVFDTATKDTGYTARGLELVRYAAAGPFPVVGIGGITVETAPAVFAAGAASVAVISDLFTGGDPESRVRAFMRGLL